MNGDEAWGPGFVRLFDIEPELFVRIPPARRHELIRRVTVPVHAFTRGPWRIPLVPEDSLGLLVVDGLLVRAFAVRGRRSTELLGRGDLLWADEVIQVGNLVQRATWRGVEAGRVALLSADTANTLRLMPGSSADLLRRAQRRLAGLALQTAMRRARIADRLLAVLCQFASRWGVRDGHETVVTIPLSHEQLADLIAAERQTTTQQLNELVRQGVISRRSDRSWVVYAAAFEELERLTSVFEAPRLAHVSERNLAERRAEGSVRSAP